MLLVWPAMVRVWNVGMATARIFLAFFAPWDTTLHGPQWILFEAENSNKQCTSQKLQYQLNSKAFCEVKLSCYLILVLALLVPCTANKKIANLIIFVHLEITTGPETVIEIPSHKCYLHLHYTPYYYSRLFLPPYMGYQWHNSQDYATSSMHA